MKPTLALALILTLLTGCASFESAFRKAPGRINDALTDPIRREHVLTQVSLEVSTAGVAIGCVALLAPTVVGLLACPLAALAYNFVMYEFILEPISQDRVKHGLPSKVGPYWERGPQDGEKFREDLP